ncbi:MAG: protein kinase [Deltaproteobacteria bacterium]|nr:protein kinase [Deltaproteobacteria bacterium]
MARPTRQTRVPLASSSFAQLLRDVAHAPELSPTPCEPLVIGETLGQYRVVERIGRGGMGVVYRAWDQRLRRTVAIKVLDRAVDRESRRRLLSEARAAAALCHPQITTVHEVVMEPRPFIVMEYVAGQPLRQLLSGEGLSAQRADRICRQLVTALAAAHRERIFHRDVKPENIIVTTDGAVKVLDFGVSQHADGTSVVDGGTARYLPAETKKLDGGRRDLHALSQVLEEIAEAIRPRRRLGRGSTSLLRRVQRLMSREEIGDASTLRARLFRQDARRKRWLQSAAVVGLLALAVVLSVRPAATDSAAIAVRSLSPQRLTPFSQDLVVWDAALSPDGKRVAFRAGRGELYISTLAERDPRAVMLPAGLRDVSCLQWNRAGLHFSARTTATPQYALWRLAEHAERATRVIALPDQEVGCFAISNDLRTLAIAHDQRIELLPLHSDRPSRRIAVFGRPLRLAWSPSGTAIAVAAVDRGRGSPRARIELIELGTPTRSTSLVEDSRLALEVGDIGLAWASDGLYYALAPWHGALGRLVKIPGRSVAALKRSRPQWLLSTGRHGASTLALDRSARRLSYLRWRSQADIYRGTLTEGGKRLSDFRRLTPSEANERPSGWSPDGKLLYLTTDRRGRSENWSIASSGGLGRPLALPAAQSAWFIEPDATRSYFWRYDSRGGSELCRVIDGDCRVVFSVPQIRAWRGNGRPGPAEHWLRCPKRPSVSSDCWLAQPAERLGVVQFRPLNGSPARAFTFEAGSFFTRGGWDTNGRWLAIAHQRRVSIVDGRGQLQQTIETPGRCLAQFISVSPNSPSMFVTTICEGSSYRLYHLDLEGRWTMLYQTNAAWLSYPEVSAGGEQIAVALMQFASNIWTVDLTGRQASSAAPAQRDLPD